MLFLLEIYLWYAVLGFIDLQVRLDAAPFFLFLPIKLLRTLPAL